MKNIKGQVIVIIVLVCCALALFGTAIGLALSDGNDKPAKDSSTTSEEWTQNY